MNRLRRGVLLTYSEAAEMLNLTVNEVTWFVKTRQMFEVTARGKKRLDRRDIVRLKRFLEQAHKWKTARGL